MRLRWTVTQRLPTWRSEQALRPRLRRGERCRVTANAVPALARRLSLVSVMLGTTLTVIGADSSRGRVASPANTARTWPLAGSCDARRPAAVGPAGGRRDLRPGRAGGHVLDAERGAGGRGAVGEAQHAGDGVGLAPFWLAALTVIAETGCE